MATGVTQMLIVGIGSPSEAVTSTLTTTSTRYAISDGDELICGYPLPRTWATPQEAEQVASGLCFHPKRMRLRPHVVPVLVTMTKYGTTLSVQEVPACH